MKTVIITIRSEVESSAPWEIDEEDYLEWLGDEEPTDDMLLEYVQSGRDTHDIETGVMEYAMRFSKQDYVYNTIIKVEKR